MTKKNIIIMSIAFVIVIISIQVGLRVLSLSEVNPSLSSQTLDDLEVYYETEPSYEYELPTLGGVGRERLVSLDLSRRYDIIVYRYEIGRYTFEEMVTYLLTEIFPYTVHLIGNRSLTSTTLEMNSLYVVLAIPSDDKSLVFIAKAEEDGYSLFHIHTFSERVHDIWADFDENVHFFVGNQILTFSWKDLQDRVR